MENNPGILLFLQPFCEFVAMTGDTFACFLDDGDRIFLVFCCDKEFRIGELELNHIPCDIDVRIGKELLHEGVHECVPFALDDEPRLVFFEFEYFNDHSTYDWAPENY